MEMFENSPIDICTAVDLNKTELFCFVHTAEKHPSYSCTSSGSPQKRRPTAGAILWKIFSIFEIYQLQTHAYLKVICAGARMYKINRMDTASLKVSPTSFMGPLARQYAA